MLDNAKKKVSKVYSIFKKIVLVILLLLLLLAAYLFWARAAVVATPNDLNFDLSKSGTRVEMMTEVSKAAAYVFVIDYFSKMDSSSKSYSDDLLALTKSEENGISIPIRVEIYKIDGDKREEILSDTYYSGGIRGQLATDRNKFLVNEDKERDIFLEAGKYLFVAQTIESFPHLKGVEIDVAFRTYTPLELKKYDISKEPRKPKEHKRFRDRLFD